MIKIFLTLGSRFLPFLLPLLAFIPNLAKNLFTKQFWDKYGKFVLIALALVGGYILYNRWQNSRTLEDVAGDSSDSKRAYAAALVLADYMGTSKELAWYQPSRWYEDETKAVKLLQENKDILRLIESKYADISRSGSLRKDIGGLLNSKEKSDLFKILGWV